MFEKKKAAFSILNDKFLLVPGRINYDNDLQISVIIMNTHV